MISRRRFLGYSAIQAAVAMGLNSASLKTLAANPSKLTQATTPLSTLARKPIPIVLVGTGYGNAVTALRLAEKGHKVVMIEMGQLWTEPGQNGKLFSPTTNKWNWAKARYDYVDGRTMWNRDYTKAPVRQFMLTSTSYKINYEAGVLDLIEYRDDHNKVNDAMQVYVGRGVGGGSLVNGAMAVTPPRSSFVEIFPEVNADEMYNKYFPLANKTLGVNIVDKAWFEKADCYLFSRVSRKTAEDSGYKTVFVPSTYDMEYLKKEQAYLDKKGPQVVLSALDQEVIFGNNAGKRSLDKTYLADAVGTGNVSIYALHQVTDIHEVPENKGGGFELTVKNTDKYLKTLSTIKIHCNALFLGAGSCGTSELLVRARDKGRDGTLPKLKSNKAIGQGWGNNGNIMSARFNIGRSGGPWTATGALQSTMPVMGINDWDNKDNPVFCEITPLPVGSETYTSMYLAITKTPQRSFFKYDQATDKVNLQWTTGQNDYSLKSFKKFLDKINTKENTTYRDELFGTGNPFGANFSYHPLGGCILGKATDNYGRVKGYDKLYVTDGSLIPGVLGVNPFVTITALAERNIEEVIKKDFS
jgi:cholesterol oxidase